MSLEGRRTKKEKDESRYSETELYNRSRKTKESDSSEFTESGESEKKLVYRCRKKQRSENTENVESVLHCQSIVCREKWYTKNESERCKESDKESADRKITLKRGVKKVQERIKETDYSDKNVRARKKWKSKTAKSDVSSESDGERPIRRRSKETEEEYVLPSESKKRVRQKVSRKRSDVETEPSLRSIGLKERRYSGESSKSDQDLPTKPKKKEKSKTDKDIGPSPSKPRERDRKEPKRGRSYTLEKEDIHKEKEKDSSRERERKKERKSRETGQSDISDREARRKKEKPTREERDSKMERKAEKPDISDREGRRKQKEKPTREERYLKKEQKAKKPDISDREDRRKQKEKLPPVERDRKKERKRDETEEREISGTQASRKQERKSSQKRRTSYRTQSMRGERMNYLQAFADFSPQSEDKSKKGKKDSEPEAALDDTLGSARSSLISQDFQDEKEPIEVAAKAKKLKAALISDVGYTKILASLVPDEIIYNVDVIQYRKYHACLLFGDASGFTDLCERYSKAGKGGPSRLTVVLNSFIGTMVQEIMTRGGDVLKFSGDAFLSWWRTDENVRDLQDCVSAAIETAMIIQKSFGRYDTDVQVTLRVKLAISAGQVAFSSIGTEDTRHYVVLGSPVWEVKIAEYLCVAGDIMVAPKAWALINAQDYDFETMPDGQHVKVLGAGAGWRAASSGYGGPEEAAEGMDWEKERESLGSILFGVEDEEEDIRSESGLSFDSEEGDEYGETSAKGRGSDARVQKDETMSLRPSVAYAVKHQMKMELRPYVIKPVLKGLDLDEPIEYLTEMRQVVIVFTNLVTLNPSMGKMIKLVDECYRIVCSSVHAHQGCVNKVSLFDKDMMFLVIFGLRGFKHEMESQIALRCGAELHERLSTVEMVRVTSVGITTGMTYCGVVGHTLRREYSVIGPTVNKAARIMVAYPGKVTCDRETFLHSRLETSNFILQEHKELKGLHQAGPIYEFREHLMPKKANILSKFPLLSRDDEMGLFLVLSEESKLRYTPPVRQSTNVRQTTIPAAVQKVVASTERPTRQSWTPERNRRSSTIMEIMNVKDIQEPSDIGEWRKSTRYFISGLVIKGETRMGKSRLMEEMIHSAKAKDTKLARIGLTPKDFQVTLIGINKILDPILNFPENSTYREKEDRLLVILRKAPETSWKYLYTLNELFHTSIDFRRTHPAEPYPNPLKAMKRCLWVLLSLAVRSYWMIGLDDLEFLDNASWKLLPVLLEKDFAFFVMTVGNRLDMEPCNEEILKTNKHLYHVNLGGINKWYQVGLACQILDVWAIPPELERIIHESSGGNPGWVESYLVTQVQQEVLKVMSMTQNESYEIGLVRPPARMITRTAARRMRSVVDPTRLHPTEDRWELFKSCYHDSEENFGKKGSFSKSFDSAGRDSEIGDSQDIRQRLMKFAADTGKKDKVIAVCIIVPGSELLGQEGEDITVSSMMLKVFDSLTSYEQMLLKCGAVLGENLVRKMLISLMSEPEPREMALCVQKLFEMQVLSCASSEFGSSSSSISRLSRLSRSSRMSMCGPLEVPGGAVSCQCPNIEVDDVCKDLPDYASCAFMRFRTPNFRDTVYSLLTDSQKREYHERAMRYLEQETRRCQACHGRHFLLLLGTRYEQYIGRRYHKRKRGRLRKRGGDMDTVSQDRSATSSYSGSKGGSYSTGSQVSLTRSSMSQEASGSTHSFLQQITYEDMLLSKIQQSWGDPDDLPSGVVIETGKASGRYLPTGFPWTLMGIFQGRGRVPSAAGLSLTRSFSSCDFTECECTLILTTVYSQLLGHCSGAELDEKTMDALLEYSEVCVNISNHAQAQRLLFEARKLLAEAKTEPQFGIKKVEDTREGSYIPTWKWPYLMGRIHTLLGYSRLEMGQYEEAHFQLHLAMTHMGVPFPENRMVLRLMSTGNNMRLSLTTSFMARAWLGLRSGFAATYSDAVAECLSYLYVVFRDKNDWAAARLAATWSLNRSLESGFDFLGVCVTFANVLEVLQYFGEFLTCAKLEVGAMEVCRNRASYPEIQELVGVGRLYRIVYHSLMTRGRLESAISVGYKTLRIAAAVHATQQRLDVLPSLICGLVSRNRVSEAVTLLNELEFIAEEDVDKTGITWYYALAMQVHLHTGYSVLPYSTCEEFFKREGEAIYTGRNPQSTHRLYIVLWLWCIRLEDWEGARLWEHLARPEFQAPDILTAGQYALTVTMIIQGLCILLSHLMDIGDSNGVTETIEKIDGYSKLFNTACSYIRFVEPYYRSVKAYYIYLTCNNKQRKRKKALRELRTASEIATRQGNARLAQWCKHNEKMWRGLLAPVKAETWRDCAEPGHLVDWHEADKTPPSIMHYTLPLPDCLD